MQAFLARATQPGSQKVERLLTRDSDTADNEPQGGGCNLPCMYTVLHTGEPASRSRSMVAYEGLQRRLLDGTFALGERLGEERLASLLGVSRTPVREALLRLGSEGHVERHPEGGWQPVAPDLDGLQDLYEVRRGLELQALLRPLDSGVPHNLSILDALHEQWLHLSEIPPETDPGFVYLDENFHLTLALAGGNPKIAALLDVVNQRIRVVRMHDFIAATRVLATIREHVGILEALLDGRLPIAEQALRSHISESLAHVEGSATRALARMLSARNARVPGGQVRDTRGLTTWGPGARASAL